MTDNFGLENEPKLKETTVNYLEFRHHQSIEDYKCDNSELVNQDARIIWASLISSLEVAGYDYLPHHFFPFFFLLKLFLFWLLFYDCPLAENTRRLF